MEPNPSDYSIGVDLGGSSIKIVAVRPDGTLLHKQISNFSSGPQMEWARAIRDSITAVQEKLGQTARRLGLAAPGLAAKDARSIQVMPGRLQGLEKLDWTDYLKASAPVAVLNDAHAALLGERWLGAARGFRHVIMITLGTGVGGAAIIDGKLLLGAVGKAGHLGHLSLDPDGPPDVCGTPGSLEVAIGNCTIQERSGGRFQTTHDLVSAFSKGDPIASDIWLKSVKALAAALASFANILDPEAAIIGGGIARAGTSLFGPLQDFLDNMEWRPAGHQMKILPAQLGELAGAYGAAADSFGSPED